MSPRRTSRRNLIASGSAALAWAAARRGRATPAIAGAVELTGRVVWPDDPAYDEARRGFNARYSRFPAAIVVCGGTEDVRNAVRWARRHGVELRARSGGHSYEAFSLVDGGLVVDVGGLGDVAVDAARGEAVVGAGVRVLDLCRRLGEHGVTLPLGTCGSIGIAGLALGGGIGFLSRRDGLTCDNLLAVDLVDADGGVLRASEADHADLFWALRGGGGGNFGIATAFTFRVRPIGEVAVYEATWPWDGVAEVLDAWQRWAPVADERLVAGLAVPDPSAGVVVSRGQFAGPAPELEALLAPLLRAGAPLSHQVRTLPFLAAAEEFAGPPITQSTFKNTSAFAYRPLDTAAIATFVDHMRASPTAANVVGFTPLGGAVAAVDPAATAFVHRQALFDLQYMAYWDEAGDEAADVAWVRELRTAMLPHTGGAYANYVDADLADWAAAYYGENLARLVGVKARYDPDDVFRGPQSIPREVG